jgi:phosphate starvation-inducible protein PhoH
MGLSTSRKQKRHQHLNIVAGTIQPVLTLDTIKPITENQRKAFTYWKENNHLFLHGVAGTGKTFMALYFALEELMAEKCYKKVYIIRSTVSTRDQGFLPGSLKEKARVFESPYVPICTKLFGRGDAYDVLKGKGMIEFVTTSYLRGETFEDCILLVDEVQNMSSQELHTIMTRIGENCRVLFAGDIKQDDLTSERKKEYSGLGDFMKILRRMPEFKSVEFDIDDIVRSQLVKSYIITKEELNL